MAREGARYILGNDPGQGITSSSTFIHVQGAYGAPTGAVGGAADGTRRGAEAPRTWVYVLELVSTCPGVSPGMSPVPSLAMGATVEHMGKHTVSIRTTFF